MFLRGGRIIQVEGTNLDVVQQPLIKAILEREKAPTGKSIRKKRSCDSLHGPHAPLSSASSRPCVEEGDLLEVSTGKKREKVMTWLEAAVQERFPCHFLTIFFLYLHSAGKLAVLIHPLSYFVHRQLCHPMLTSATLFLSWMDSMFLLAMPAEAKNSPTNLIPTCVGLVGNPLVAPLVLNLAMSWT